MRIIFIDMHCINFLTNVYSQIKSGMKVKTYKHKFLVDYALSHGIKICNYISGEDSTNRWLSKAKRIIKNKAVYVWEHNYVIRHSYGDDCEISAIKDAADIKADDIVIGYFYKGIQRSIIKELPGHKVMMGNHFISVNEPINLGTLGLEAFVNEIDLTDNEFVKTYLGVEGVRQIVCPYIYGERFRNLYQKRNNKLMGIGTLSTVHGNPDYKLFRAFFDTEWVQPMRKVIMDNADQHLEEMDSYISYINEDKKVVNDNDGFLIALYKKIYNRFKPWTQSKYTSFDMVEKFNEYTMFACPEELVGMPGIGFVEGMACGTLYVGLDTEYYRKLGLIPGENYITYDGTFDDLIDVIQFYQQHIEETERIAQNGEMFVRKNFNEEVVAENFYKELSALL